MKKTLPLFLAVIAFLFASANVDAQVTLTSATSTPLYGDTFHYISHLDSVLAVEHSGANQTWDFSNAGGTTGTRAFDSIHSNNSHLQFPQNNLVEQAFPYIDRFYLTSQSALRLVGITTPIFGYHEYMDMKDVLRFPMSYGDTFSDNYSGPSNTSLQPSTVNGAVQVMADGIGTLILPYATVNNVLRIKTVDNYTEQVQNGQTFSVSDTTYTWYDMANRNYLAQYQIIYGQHRTSYLEQVDFLVGIEPTTVKDNFLRVYPNPAMETVNLSLDAASPTSVNIVLSDVIGRKVFSKVAAAGPSMPTIVLDLAGLPKGFYILAVTAGNKLIGRQRVVLR